MKKVHESTKGNSNNQAVSQARNEEDHLFKEAFKTSILDFLRRQNDEPRDRDNLISVVAAIHNKTPKDVFPAFIELESEGQIEKMDGGFVLKRFLQGKPPSVNALWASMDEMDSEISKAVALMETMADKIFRHAQDSGYRRELDIANGFEALVEATILSLHARQIENWDWVKALREKFGQRAMEGFVR